MDNASQTSNPLFRPTGIMDSEGNPYFAPNDYTPQKSNPMSSRDGEGVITPLWKPEIGRDVELAKWGLVALSTAFVSACFLIQSQIDNRFDRADSKISTVSDRVAELRIEIVTHTSDLKLLLEKQNGGRLDANESAGQLSAVHAGPSRQTTR